MIDPKEKVLVRLWSVGVMSELEGSKTLELLLDHRNRGTFGWGPNRARVNLREAVHQYVLKTLGKKHAGQLLTMILQGRRGVQQRRRRQFRVR